MVRATHAVALDALLCPHCPCSRRRAHASAPRGARRGATARVCAGGRRTACIGCALGACDAGKGLLPVQLGARDTAAVQLGAGGTAVAQLGAGDALSLTERRAQAGMRVHLLATWPPSQPPDPPSLPAPPCRTHCARGRGGGGQPAGGDQRGRPAAGPAAAAQVRPPARPASRRCCTGGRAEAFHHIALHRPRCWRREPPAIGAAMIPTRARLPSPSPTPTPALLQRRHECGRPHRGHPGGRALPFAGAGGGAGTGAQRAVDTARPGAGVGRRVCCCARLCCCVWVWGWGGGEPRRCLPKLDGQDE